MTISSIFRQHAGIQSSFYWVLIIVSALLTPLTFAPYRLFWLMPFLFAILVVCRQQLTHRLLSVYIWAWVAYTAQFYWINTALHDIAGLPQPYAIPVTLLLPAYLAIYPALCFWLLDQFRVQLWIKIGWVLPFLWTITEYIREHALTGFGWGALGYSQINASPLAAYAPISGLQLVTLATALTGCWLACLLLLKRVHARIWCVLGLIVLWGTGWCLHDYNFTRPDGTQATVALIQGNIKQSLKWDESQFLPTLQQYYSQLASTKADIVVLPETAIPMIRQDLPDDILMQFAKRAQDNGSALALGIPQRTMDQLGYQNAIINLSHYSAQGNHHNIPYYAKNHLVPFGEYIPLSRVTGWLYQLMDMPLAGFSPGGHQQNPLSLANQKIAFNICYEDGFGDELIYGAKRASMLANVSNMAWYGQSHAMNQQLQQSQTRALEMGRFMVRATNNGVTAIINNHGRVIQSLPPDVAQVLTGKVYGYHGNTPFMRLGGARPLIVILTILCLLLYTYGRWFMHDNRKK